MTGPPGSASASVGVRSVLAVVLAAFFVDGRSHPLDQALGDPVLAAVRDHPAKLGLELGRAVARPAPVEMDADLLAAYLGQLAVKIVVQLVHRLGAVDGGPEQAGRIHAGARARLLPALHVISHRCHQSSVVAHSLDPPGTLPTSPRASATW